MNFVAANLTEITTNLTASTLGIDLSKSRTVSVWCNATSFASAGKVFSIGDVSSTNTYFQFRTNGTTDTWRISYNSTGINFTATGSTGTWTNFIITFDGTTTIVYTNGVSSGSLVTTPSIPSAATLELAFGSVSTVSYYDGAIADLRIYNRVLTAGEIAAIANSNGHDGVVSGIQGRWFVQAGTIGSSLSPNIVVSATGGITTDTPPTVVAPSGSNRLLILVVGNEQTTQNNNVTAATYGTRSLTFGARHELWDASASASSHIEIWYLMEAGIAAASSGVTTVTWSAGSAQQAIFFLGFIFNVGNQTTPIKQTSSNGIIGSGSDNPITSGPLNPFPGDILISVAHAGDGGTSPIYTTSGTFALLVAQNSSTAASALGAAYLIGPNTQPPTSVMTSMTFVGPAGTPSRQSALAIVIDGACCVLDANSASDVTQIASDVNGYQVEVTSGAQPIFVDITPLAYTWD